MTLSSPEAGAGGQELLGAPPATRASLSLVLLAAFAASALIGLVVGVAVYGVLMTQASRSDAFRGLVESLVGVGAGGLAAVVTYVTVAMRGLRRRVERSMWARATLAVVAAPVVMVMGVGAVSFATFPTSRALLLPALLVVLALPWLLLLGSTGRLPWSWLAAAGALAVISGGAASVVEPRLRTDALTARYDAAGAPLALLGGTTLTMPVPAWRAGSVVEPRPASDDRRVQVWSLAGSSSIALSFQLGPPLGCPPRSNGRFDPAPARTTAPRMGSCSTIGDTSHGPILASRPAYSRGITQMWVEVPGGQWLLEHDFAGRPGSMTVSQGRDVLAALQPVDVRTFVRVAHPGGR